MLAYLATPYSKYPLGVEQAFIDAAKLAARLLLTGIKVYSPICHAHPIAIYGNINSFDHSIWLPFNELMMARCDALIVTHMDEWQESVGIKYEIMWFEKAEKSVFDLNIDTLMMVKRK